MTAPIQAFVLKCPECGAPQPGTTSTCAYCKVPLMWAPTRRFGSDDHGLYDVEDEPGTELMAFGPHVVLGACSQRFEMQPAKIVRPRFLWIHPRCADNVHVFNVRMGVTRLGDVSGSDHRISGSLFARGRGWPLDCDAMIPGILFHFEVSNRTAGPIEVEGALRVMPFKDADLPRSGWGPQIVGLKRR